MSELEGRTVGEYQLLEVVDRSGESLVIKAFHPKMNRYAALKVLSPSAMKNQVMADEFKRQSERSAQVEHRNILPIYDYGETEGVIYRATRFVESGSLADHLSWFYDLTEALRLFNSIGAGLEEIHTKGMVHGNLKPTNVLIDQDKQPLLTDFGIAKRTGASVNVYMSPEQVQGTEVDKRTDIYALGVLLYHVLTGEAPPKGAVATPSSRRSELPESVDRVVLKAMAQNPSARFSSTSEFLTAFEESLQKPPPEPVQPAAAPTPVPAQAPPAAQPKAKRDTSWVVFLFGAIFVLCLVVGGIYLATQALRGDEAEPAPTEEVVPTLAPPTEAPPEPTEAPPEQPQPTEAPPEVSPPIEIPEVCGSLGGATGMIAIGLVLAGKRRKKRVP